MKVSFLTIAIGIAFLLVACQAQVGGGNSAGESEYTSSTDHYSNETLINNTSDRTTQEQESGGVDPWFIAIILGFASLVYYSHHTSKKRIAERIKQIENIFNNFEAQSQSNPCKLTQVEMEKQRDWFMSNKWQINYKSNDNTFTDIATVSLTGLKPKSSYSYKLSMSMKDRIGPSESQGILAHHGDRLSVIFVKTYDNREVSGQTGPFDILVYKGAQEGNILRGKWYYKEYEKDLKYSGTWQMLRQQ